ncbi:CRISPR-associated protein Cse2 (CRISPR_cse2) [Streptomyces sp. cf386]|uniref:type I-E CRISPR-associated protein Cse2/CasB n=1 Tax=Streptomyces sp. cf386 TaxID=1761904 RepID=UPI000888C453|nr:type I-E CRISPR-associated protein Cse2/CasB [Streptomyces sp. cf386]SDP62779.1 CRISPR-associated protein Cse2 (CRISPR_cse2) [Streptomyces sp. cf386]
MSFTTTQRRAHYDDFVHQVITLCAINSIRADLNSGFGRPVAECPRMPEHLTRHIAGFGAHRAHYTVAGLIAQDRDLPHEDAPYQSELATPAKTPTAAVGAAADAPPPLQDPAPAPQPGPAARPWRSRPDLGTHLAIAVARYGFKEATMTNRVKTLTKLDTELLHPRLWSLTSHLRSRDAARLDFAVLLEDLAWWDHDQLETAARWRENYFLTLHTLSAKEH